MEEAVAGVELPLRIQDEVACRHCDVHCEKVVYPGACLRMACPFVYAYEEFGHTYIGCMQKVYEVEIDVDLLHEAEVRRGGFGAVRSVRQPLPRERQQEPAEPRSRPSWPAWESHRPACLGFDA